MKIRTIGFLEETVNMAVSTEEEEKVVFFYSAFVIYACMHIYSECIHTYMH